MRVVLCILVVSCRAPVAVTQQFSVTDSAGISIAVNSAAHDTGVSTWVVSELPSLSIGAADGPAESLLHRVSGLAQLSDGRIVFLNAGICEVRIYRHDGKHLLSTGTQGSGPGEFRWPISLHPLEDDTVAVYDPQNARLSFFDRHGVLARTQPVPTLSGLRGLIGDTAITAAPRVRRPIVEGVEHTPMVVLRIQLTTASADTIVVSGARQELQAVVGEEVVSIPVPFTVHASVRVANGRIFVADGQQAEFRVYRSDGSVERIVRMPGIKVAVAGDDFRAAVDAFLSGNPSRTYSAVANRLRNLQPPSVYPHYDDLIVTENGDVWLRHFDRNPDTSRRWSVVDKEGRWIGTARSPAGLRIAFIAADYVLGYARDELGVEYVRRHTVISRSE